MPAALLELRQAIGDNTILLPLLNGVDIYPRVRAQIERGIVLQACVYVGTHIDRPGHVVQAGGACKILFGPDPQRPDFDPREVIQLFDQAGIQSEWTTHIQTEIWQKYIFICSFGLVSAASGKSLGEILTSDRLGKDVETVMEEVLSLAKAIGVLLPAEITASSLQKARGFPYAARTSFQRDFERPGKKDERDLFVGTVTRMADELDIAVPKIRELADDLARKKPNS